MNAHTSFIPNDQFVHPKICFQGYGPINEFIVNVNVFDFLLMSNDHERVHYIRERFEYWLYVLLPIVLTVNVSVINDILNLFTYII